MLQFALASKGMQFLFAYAQTNEKKVEAKFRIKMVGCNFTEDEVIAFKNEFGNLCISGIDFDDF